jgi:biopolymer transport protein ExbD
MRGLLILALLGACDRDQPTPVAPPSEDAVAACALTLMDISKKVGELSQPGGLANLDVLRDYARGCADLYRETECREAWRKVADTPRAPVDTLDAPSDARITLVGRACSSAYCQHLPEPKPTACAANIDEEKLFASWPELNNAILTRDLAAVPTLVKAIQKLFTPVVVPLELPPSASVAEAPPRFEVEIDADGQVSVNGARVSDERLLELAQQAAKSPDARAVIKANRDTRHGRVMQILDLLKRANMARIAFAATPLPSSTAP